MVGVVAEMQTNSAHCDRLAAEERRTAKARRAASSVAKLSAALGVLSHSGPWNNTNALSRMPSEGAVEGVLRTNVVSMGLMRTAARPLEHGEVSPCRGVITTGTLSV